MLILDRLRQSFAAALDKAVQHFIDQGSADSASSTNDFAGLSQQDLESYAAMVRPTADPRFGDYQANCAMPLAKILGRAPRDIATALVHYLDVADMCDDVQIAGPGFINLRLKSQFLGDQIALMLKDDRLGVPLTTSPRTIVVDYSSPNVAKPMHVGHIRSTVIGDALARTFRFMGHHVITDNHLGDWGTQFGMVIYGFKHFGDEAALTSCPVDELSRLYRLVNRIIEYHTAASEIESARTAVADTARMAEAAQDAIAAAKEPKEKKSLEKSHASISKKHAAAIEKRDKLELIVTSSADDATFMHLAAQHPDIADAVLNETARLHEGDADNLALWKRFLPYCRDEIDRIYQRLDVSFDHTLGESFYHEMLGKVVEDLRSAGLASDSEGAVCVFLPDFDAPMIVRKRDGAFLYATTDLATLFYRRQHFAADEILYVVDSRQSEHFEKLFAVARRIGFEDIQLVHVNFGTVLGADGRPFKTRSGSSVGLESLLDEAVSRAMAVVCDPERSARLDPPMDDFEKRQIASVVGHGAIKYADLSHHRTSDYKFDLQKMVSMDGNTSTYIQYAYARVSGIMQKGGTELQQIARFSNAPLLDDPSERALAMTLLKFGESLAQVRAEYAPNFLVDYLYETARAYAVFNENCPVLKASDDQTTRSRLVLVATTARVLRQGLELLGIQVVARM
ncbi:MAG TPA: arginine--tRNA ligase [Planctomycetaceae bacterium]|nr:arginine--tRNA ligase [Planctomycetaceae bacterium]